MNQVVEEEMAKNDKSIAFNASRDTSDSDSSEDDDEYAVMLRKVKDLIMKREEDSRSKTQTRRIK